MIIINSLVSFSRLWKGIFILIFIIMLNRPVHLFADEFTVAGPHDIYDPDFVAKFYSETDYQDLVSEMGDDCQYLYFKSCDGGRWPCDDIPYQAAFVKEAPDGDCTTWIFYGSCEGSSLNSSGGNFRCYTPVDEDGDSVWDFEDNCPDQDNADQADWDNNGIGDVCDTSDKTTLLGLNAFDVKSNTCQFLHGNPVNIFIGNNVEIVTDIRFSSPFENWFVFSRAYNSQSILETAIGSGWTHNFNVQLTIDYNGASHQLRILDETGAGFFFEDDDEDGTFDGILSENSTITTDSDGHYLWDRDGIVYEFDDTTGSFLSITDRNGNIRTLTYNTDDLLETVLDEASGRNLTFHYNEDNRISHISGPVTTAVPDGIWVSYAYDTNANLTTVTYADDGNGSTASGFDYRYEDSQDVNNMTAKYDLAGHLISTWTYDEEDRAIENYNREGKGVTINYDDPDNISVTDAWGITSEYALSEIDSRKKITGKTVTNACASCATGIVRTEFDETNGMPTEREWVNGRIDQFQDYDDNHNAGTHIMSAGTDEEKTVTTDWHPVMDVPLSRTTASSLADDTNPDRNHVVTWDYDDPDAAGNTDTPNEDPTSRVNRLIESGYTLDASGAVTAFEHITTMTYTANGQVETIDGPLAGSGDTVSFAYDGNNGDLLFVTSPVTGTRTFEYDEAGNIIRTVDENGIETLFTLDGRNRIIATVTDGVTSSRTFDAAGSLAGTTDGAGRTLDYTYNTNGFLQQVLNAAGAYQYYSYDDKGNPIESSLYSASGSQAFYRGWDYGDPAINSDLTPGKPWKILEKNADGSQTLETVIAYEYGETIQVTDPLGKIRETAYDSRNRITRSSAMQTDGDTASTAYVYDTAGNLISVTDPEGNETTYQYDDAGNMVQQVSPESGTTLYQYDAAGNLIQKRVNSADPLEYDYDGQNRLTAVRYTDSARDITYTYDEGTNGIGRLTGTTDPSGSYAYAWDSLGRPVSETKTISGVSYTTAYGWDDAGSLTSVTYPSGRTVTYERDAAGNIITVTSEKDGTTQTLAENITHQPFGPVDGLDFGNGKTLARTFDQRYLPMTLTADGVMENSYTVGNSGNISAITDSLNTTDQAFTFDDLYRLTRAEGSNGDYVYEYDLVGNRQRKTKNSEAQVYTYFTGTNQLHQVEGGSITAGERILSYNLNERLESISENDVVLGAYEYDSQGRRTHKTVDGSTTVYHYNLSGLLITESGMDGTITKEYVYLEGRPLAMVVPDENGEDLFYFYHNDHLGTPQVMTDMAGVVVWQAVYSPFGEADISVGTVENNLRFPGQYFDAETGNHYNLHRFYDPGTGRYITPDPIGLAGGINPFVYAENNPTRFIDPLGLSPIFLNSDERDEVLYNAMGTDKESVQNLRNSIIIDFAGQVAPVLMGLPPGSFPGSKSLCPTKRSKIKKAQLPTQVKGKVRYVPPKNWHPGEPLPRGPRGGYMDKFGNEWTKGPSRTKGQPFEWDVQRPDGTHWNISIDGKVTH